jgi:hypothetical protein
MHVCAQIRAGPKPLVGWFQQQRSKADDSARRDYEERKDNKVRLQMPEFEQYVKSNGHVMSKTAKLISDLVEYGEARAKAGVLEKTLSLPVTAQKSE